MPDQGDGALARSLGLRASALRSYWLKGFEYYGPFSPEQRERYRILRWVYSKQLSDEAVQRWGVSRLEADIAAEAAVSSLSGVLGRLAELTTIEDLMEERTH